MEQTMERRRNLRAEELFAEDVIEKAAVSYGKMDTVPRGEYFILAISAKQIMDERDNLKLLLHEVKQLLYTGHHDPVTATHKLEKLLHLPLEEIEHRVASRALMGASETLFSGGGFVGRMTVRNVLKNQALKEKHHG